MERANNCPAGAPSKAVVQPRSGFARIIDISESLDPSSEPPRPPMRARRRKTAAARVSEAAAGLFAASEVVYIGAWISAALWPLAAVILAMITLLFASAFVAGIIFWIYGAIVAAVLFTTTIRLQTPSKDDVC